MKILLSLILFLAFCLPAWSTNIGQVEQITPAYGVPNFADQNIMPSLGTPVSTRSPGAAIIATNNATTFTVIGGLAAVTVLGTASNGLGSDGNWINYATAASSGSQGGIYGGPFTEYRQNPRFITTIKTGASATDLSDNIIWIGVEFGQNYTTGTPSATTDMAAFRYAPSVDGTAFWRVVTSRNGTSNVIVTTSSIATATEYTLGIDATGSSYNFYINGIQVASTSTDLPTNTTACYWEVVESTTAAQAVNLKIKNVWFDCL